MKMDVQLSPQNASTKHSRTSSLSSSRTGSNLSLDLSAIPPLMEPSPPTNTLLITNLNNLEIFRPDHLQSLHELISQTAPTTHWSPLKSFRRIVTSFESEEDSIKIRTLLDGEALMGERIRVYFGQHTPVLPVDNHLAAPESKKLFFISPPPSPPHGWEMRDEAPPNSQTHAEDLAEALKKLSWNTAVGGGGDGKTNASTSTTRARSGSFTVILEEGDLPGITVDDMSDDEGASPAVAPDGYVPVVPISQIHTSRPPVETMQDA